jgi:colicin import membrane protein
MADSVKKQFLGGLKGIGGEFGEKLKGEGGKIVESIITGKELLGNITTMTDNQLAQKQAEDEKKRQEEINRLRGELKEQGRNVEGEIERIREEKKREEEEKEKREEYEKEQQEREAFQQEQMMPAEIAGKSKKGKQPKKGPKQDDQSETREFPRKKD